MLAAVAVHGALLGSAFASTAELGRFARTVHGELRARLTMVYDVEEAPSPPPPPEPAPEPEPEPEPVVKPAPQLAPQEARPAEPPPTAEAGQVLAQEPEPNQPVDLTGDGFVMGTAESYAGGFTSSVGTSKRAVATRVTTAAPSSTGKALQAKVAEDRSRPAQPQSLDPMRRCGFPPEADAAQVDAATVLLAVVVSAQGGIESVKVLSESPAGLGFGARAKACAFRARYEPALAANGQPILAATPPIRVNFTRAR
jgi:protein TonB